MARVYMREDIKHKPGTNNVTKAASDVVSQVDIGNAQLEADLKMGQTCTQRIRSPTLLKTG